MKQYLFVLLTLLLISHSAWAVKGNCDESYVPPYTYDQMLEVKNWATGGAFAIYAKHADVIFDKKSYNEDNPYLALFNFSRATATSCLEMDLLQGYLSMSWALENILGKIVRGEYEEGITFRVAYMKRAIKYGFDIYITLPEGASDEDNASVH